MTRGFVGHRADVELDQWPGIVEWQTLIGGATGPAIGITAGLATIPPGAAVEGAEHHHEHPEAYLFLAGHGTVDLDGVEHPVTAGSFVAIPGGVRHHVRNDGPGPLRFHFVFPADRLADVEYRFS